MGRPLLVAPIPLSPVKSADGSPAMDRADMTTTRETADHAELARLSEAATQGPWKACGTIYEHMNCEVRGGEKGEGQAIAQVWDGPNAFRDGQFIAAANPATVLALLSEIAALRGEVERLARINADHCSAVNTYVISNARLDDRATQAERQRDELRKAMPDLSSVIAWLNNGCEPKHAVTELTIYKTRIDQALANQGADQ